MIAPMDGRRKSSGTSAIEFPDRTGYHPARCEIEVVADELTRADVELYRQR